MKIRRFNDSGIECMEQFLDSLTTTEPVPYPKDLLTDMNTSAVVQPAVEIETRTFTNRFEVAEYLDNRLAEAAINNVEQDRGLWAWLALFYFNELCPVDANGRRHPGERARWIPAIGDFRKYYRHLLAGPFRIYRAHRDCPHRALALLCTPPHSPGDVAEQLVSRQELVTNRAIMQMATNLYVDSDTGRPKRGAAGRGPGSARRLADVMNQFDVTWDLYAMSPEAIFNMVPAEFDRFR